MSVLKLIFGIVAMVILIMCPHLLVIFIWYPIGLILCGIYKGFKGETTTQNKGDK